MTLDDLVKAYNEGERLCSGGPARDRRAGVAAVVWTIRDWCVLNAQHYAWDAHDFDDAFRIVLGSDAGAAGDAITQTKESENEDRRNAGPLAPGQEDTPGRLERQEHVARASGSRRKQQDDTAVRVHRVPQQSHSISNGFSRSLDGVTDGPAGDGLGRVHGVSREAGEGANTVDAKHRHTTTTSPASGFCEWTQKWHGFNSWKVQCRESAEMYGADHDVVVPTSGTVFCHWCGKPIRFKEGTKP